MRVRKPAVAVFAMAGLLGLVAPVAAEPGDARFLGALDQMGISTRIRPTRSPAARRYAGTSPRGTAPIRRPRASRTPTRA